MDFDCDVAVVGSGFGGAVSALRLAEKGYDVVVLEQGRRLAPEDIEKARTDLREHVWEPDLGLHGYFWQKVFRDVGIIGASGVGGGSIVWGAVLLEPPDRVFADPAWGEGEHDWAEAMTPHYAEAARMLGRVENPFTGEMDDHLQGRRRDDRRRLETSDRHRWRSISVKKGVTAPTRSSAARVPSGRDAGSAEAALPDALTARRTRSTSTISTWPSEKESGSRPSGGSARSRRCRAEATS